MNDNDIKIIAELMKVQFSNLDKRLEKFEGKVDKLEEKVEEKFDSLNTQINKKTIDIELLKKETERTAKTWSLLIGGFASIIITVITKMMGL